MRVALLFLTFCGLLLCIDAKCDANDCAKKDANCGDINIYINCLINEENGCTTNQKVQAASINNVINAETAKRNNMGCSGANTVSVSLSTMVLAIGSLYIRL